MIKTGQLFLGSKFAGVANTATALGGTGLPPCPAYDFACALRGTFALTVEPGEKLAPAKLRAAWAASAATIEMTFSVTTSCPTKSNLFKKTVVRMSSNNQQQVGLGSSPTLLPVYTLHKVRRFCHRGVPCAWQTGGGKRRGTRCTPLRRVGSRGGRRMAGRQDCSCWLRFLHTRRCQSANRSGVNLDDAWQVGGLISSFFHRERVESPNEIKISHRWRERA